MINIKDSMKRFFKKTKGFLKRLVKKPEEIIKKPVVKPPVVKPPVVKPPVVKPPVVKPPVVKPPVIKPPVEKKPPKAITDKAILNRLKFMEFVDAQPATLSAHKILKKYRSQGGHIDHNYAYPYVTHVTDQKTRLDYTIIYESKHDPPRIIGQKIFDKILSKRMIAQKSQELVRYADLTEALEIHLKWTRIALRTTTLKSYAIEEPFRIDEVF